MGMLAYFHKGQFVKLFYDQRNEQNWLENTAKSLGHSPQDVEVFDSGDTFKNNETYLFQDSVDNDGNKVKELVKGRPVKQEVTIQKEVAGKMEDVIELVDGIEFGEAKKIEKISFKK